MKNELGRFVHLDHFSEGTANIDGHTGLCKLNLTCFAFSHLSTTNEIISVYFCLEPATILIMAKVSVLFFCLGNICRSPVAEAVFRKAVHNAGLDKLIAIDSAATSHWEVGNPADYRSAETAIDHGYELDSISRQLTEADLKKFDLLIGMERKNLDDACSLLRPTESERAKFALLRDWDPEGTGPVPDPYYGSKADFIKVQNIVERCVGPLLEDIRSKFSL